MTVKVNVLLPCMTFFAAGQVMSGLLNLFMQLTVVFWPAAVSMARRHIEVSGTERMLHSFADLYQVPVRYDAIPRKRFRRHDGSDVAWDVMLFGNRSAELVPAS